MTLTHIKSVKAGQCNNPDPLETDPDAVCCHSCDVRYVLPARIAEYNRSK